MNVCFAGYPKPDPNPAGEGPRRGRAVHLAHPGQPGAEAAATHVPGARAHQPCVPRCSLLLFPASALITVHQSADSEEQTDEADCVSA